MSIRLQIGHKEKIGSTTITYRVDINDDNYSGSIQEKVAGGNFFSWEYESIDERDPFESPVQKSTFTCELIVRNDTDFAIFTDILDADEDRFSIDFYIDGVHKWSGKVLNDLVEYQPGGTYPFTVNIKAKDLSTLAGDTPELGLISSRTRLSEVIATCLKGSGFTLPIRSYTNITNTELTESDDFLHGLYHENRAFQTDGQSMNSLETLETICRAYNLILRQSDARWIIEQIPAVAKGDDTQFDYDSDGLNPVSSTPDRTITIDRLDKFLLPGSTFKLTSALKSIESSYNHKTPILNIPTEDVEYDSEPTSSQIESFLLTFENEGAYSFAGTFDVEAELSDNNPGGSIVEGYISVVGNIDDTGDVFLDEDGDWQQTSEILIPITLSGAGTTVTGSFDMEESGTVPSIVHSIAIEFFFAEMVDDVGTGVTVEETDYTNINTYIFQTSQSIRDEEAAINHRYTRQGNYSVNEEIPETVIGSGPTPRSVGAAASAVTGVESILTGGFLLKGESTEITLEKLTLRERVSMRRNALQNIRARLWMKYSPESLIEYNGDVWFFLGGNFVAKQSRWDANILLLDYERDDATDSFESFVEEGGAPTGTTSTGSSSPGGGGGGEASWSDIIGKPNSEGAWATETGFDDRYLFDDFSNVADWTPADDRFFQIDNDLSEGNPVLMQDNLGLTNGSANLYFNSLATGDIIVNGQNLFPDGGEQALGTGDTPTWNGATFTNEIYIEQGGDSLVIDSAADDRDDARIDWYSDPDNPSTRSAYFGYTNGDFRLDAQALGGRFFIDNTNLQVEGTTTLEDTLIISGQDIEWQDVELTAGDENMPTGLSVRATSNPSDGQPIFGVESSGSASRFSVTQNNGGAFNEALHVGYNFDDGVIPSSSYTLNVDGNSLFEDEIELAGDVAWTTLTFNTGFLGNGARVYEEASEYHFETDVGFFRSALFANEFIINQILATQGSRIAGPGRGKIEAVINDSSGSEVVEVSDPEGNEYAAFAENDLILCLQVRNDLDIGTTNVLEDSGGVIVKRYVRRVTDVTTNEVTFTTPADAPSDAAGPAQGDVIVAFGNTTDTTRQNLLYETVIEPNAPYTALKTGIDSWTAYKAAGNLQMKYGNLNQSYGYTSDTFGMAVGPPNSDHATFDPDDGVRFIDGSGNVGAQFNNSVLTLGTGSNFVTFDVDAGTGNIELDTFDLSANGLSITTQDGIDVGSDFWHNDNSFQFGGSDGITYPVSGNVRIGSDVDIFGDLSVQSLPQVSDEGLQVLFRFEQSIIIGAGGRALIDPASGQVSDYVTSPAGFGAEFTAPNDSVDSAWPGVTGSTNRCVSFWYRSKSDLTSSSERHTISNWGLNNTGERYTVEIYDDSGGRVRVEVSGGFKMSDTGDLQDGNWHHIIIDLSGNNVTDHIIQIDGIEETSYTQSPQAVNTSSDGSLTVGDSFTSGRELDAYLDELRIYNRSLSISERKNLYLHPSGNSGGFISANTIQTGRIESTNLETGSGRVTTGFLGDLNDGILSAGYGGDNVFHVDSESNEATLAGFSFNATEFQSTNNTGYETSGLYMDSDGERMSLGTAISFDDGAGVLRDLSIAGELSMDGTLGSIRLPEASNGTRGWIDRDGITLPSVSDQALNFAYAASAGVSDASIYTDDADMFIYGHGDFNTVRSITIEPNPSDFGYGLTNIGGMLTLYDKDSTSISGSTGSLTGISRSRLYIEASGGPTITEMTTQQPLQDGMFLFVTVARGGSNMFFDYTSGGNISTRNDDPLEVLPGGTMFFIYDGDFNRWSMQQDRN